VLSSRNRWHPAPKPSGLPIGVRRIGSFCVASVLIADGHAMLAHSRLSGFSEKQYAVSALRAGAAGYVAKDQAPEEFMRAVQTVLAGRRYVSSTLGDTLICALDGSGDQPLHASLSQRDALRNQLR
jgi:DNA-binding NarL/FixJ family response regulator